MENNITKPVYNTTIPSDWEVKKLGTLVEIVSGVSPSLFILKSDGLYPYLKVEDLNNCEKYQTVSREYSDDEKYLVPFNSVIFPKRGAAILNNKVRINTVDVQMDSNLMAIYPKSNRLNYEYLYYQITFEQLHKIADTSTIPQINNKHIIPYSFPLPPLPEQRAIAHVLSLMDTAINKNNQLIAQKELRKKWLMQNLLTGKKRLKGFENGKWRTRLLMDILTPSRKSFAPKEDELYQQIGIRSHTKGLFYKEKVTGANLGDKSVFWIEPDCFIVNIVFAWEHAIAKTTENEIGMIVSHRFPMYKPKRGILYLDYLLYYFKSPRGKHLLGLASPGGAGRNKTLGQIEFLKLQIPVPSIEEQTAIARVLQAADKEIQLLKTKTEKLREQKKGMMQVLLTGKKRLKIENA
jgi:type I restriction enzyme, S subunit